MRICSGGCGSKVPDGQRFCDDCQPVKPQDDGIRENQRTDGYNEELDALRKTSRWQRRRAQVVKEEPMCQRCGLERTEIVDHIVPAQIAVQQARASGKYPLDKNAGYFLRSNLQGLCGACHRTKTNEDKEHVGDWPDVVEKEAQQPRKQWTF
jgi:5-methylcytosine-specific restriction endonuclease McrA